MWDFRSSLLHYYKRKTGRDGGRKGGRKKKKWKKRKRRRQEEEKEEEEDEGGRKLESVSPHIPGIWINKVKKSLYNHVFLMFLSVKSFNQASVCLFY